MNKIIFCAITFTCFLCLFYFGYFDKEFTVSSVILDIFLGFLFGFSIGILLQAISICLHIKKILKPSKFQ